MLEIDVITLFPDFFDSPLKESMLRIAQNGFLKINICNLRDYAYDKHKMCDDKPFGGGPGMVMKPEPIFECVGDIRKKCGYKKKLIFLTPQGRRLTQDKLGELSKEKGFILLCGRYEGIDQRVRDFLVDEEISIGDYVLTGGEIPALVLIDGMARLIPGVLGNSESVVSESFQGELLDYPHYTRPREYKGMKAPDILFSGDHEKVKEWRLERAKEMTEKVRELNDKREEKEL